MDGERNSTPGIEDVFAIVELLKKYKTYEHEAIESTDIVTKLEEEALKIIEGLKVENNSSKLNARLSIKDYSEKEKWKFSMSTNFPSLKQLKGKGTEKSILQHAVENYSDADKTVKKSLKLVIKCLISRCPDLIVSSKEGAAPLLSVILMQSDKLVKLMLKQLEKVVDPSTKEKDEKSQVGEKQPTKENGNKKKQVDKKQRLNMPKSVDVMKGIDRQLRQIDFSKIGRGRILCTCSVYQVVALMLNERLFDIFLTYCGELCIKRGNHERFGDNVLHALVRYGSRAQSKINGILTMLKHLHNLQNGKHRKVIHSLWMQTNGDGLTPLQLAAKIGQHQIFEFIMSLEMLYYFRDGDEDCYDITEIDTVPSEGNNEADGINPDGNQNDGNKNKQVENKAHKPVLHLIRYVSDKYSIPIANMPAVKAAIDTKWKYYRVFIWVWFIIHLAIMGLCAWYAVIRAQLTNPFVKDNSKKVDRAYGLGVLILVYGIFCLVMQVIRNINKFRRKRYKMITWGCFSSRFMFPWFFGLFGLLIVFDFGLACGVANYGNFLLPYVLILGWGLSLYFLQVINYFSVFVVMIQRLSSIMIQFAIVTSLFMVGFSVAAYLALHDVELENDEDTFKHFGKTVFKMLTIMIGLGDLDVVFDAEYLIMTISIFVMFALLTTILLLNALIAYMSEICSLIAEYGKRGSISSKVYARLQRVTVIVQLEDFLPCCLLKEMGNIDALTSFPDEKRKYITLRSPVEPQADSPIETYEENDDKTDHSADKDSSGESRDRSQNNKVFPDKVKTLEITEITQAFCEHDCVCCENKGRVSTRVVK